MTVPSTPPTDTVATPISTTDPYQIEKANTKPVRLRLTRRDGTVHRFDGDRRALDREHQQFLPLVRIDGILYLARGTDGAEHLYTEVAVLVLDRLPSPAEDDAFRAGRKLGIEQAAGVVDRTRAVYDEQTKRALDKAAAAVRAFGASQ